VAIEVEEKKRHLSASGCALKRSQHHDSETREALFSSQKQTDRACSDHYDVIHQGDFFTRAPRGIAGRLDHRRLLMNRPEWELSQIRAKAAASHRGAWCSRGGANIV
jgi:hypothetical protein